MENILLNMPGTTASVTATSLKLEGLTNWCTWKFQVKIILQALDIYGVVDGSMVKPENGADQSSWLQKDAKAQSILVTRLSNKVMLQVMTCDSAKAIWDKLHVIYEQTSETSLHLLQQKFFGMQYNTGEDIATFLARIEENVSQIKQLKGEVPEKMVITKIITSLPDMYKHFVSAWDSVQSEKQTLSELTARLLIEEQRTNNR